MGFVGLHYEIFGLGLMRIEYQIIVQWSERNQRYEAYSPTIMGIMNQFAPDFPRYAYADTPSRAVENAIIQVKNAIKLLRRLAILPPPPDVNDVSDYYEDRCKISI